MHPPSIQTSRAVLVAWVISVKRQGCSGCISPSRPTQTGVLRGAVWVMARADGGRCARKETSVLWGKIPQGATFRKGQHSARGNIPQGQHSARVRVCSQWNRGEPAGTYACVSPHRETSCMRVGGVRCSAVRVASRPSMLLLLLLLLSQVLRQTAVARRSPADRSRHPVFVAWVISVKLQGC